MLREGEGERKRAVGKERQKESGYMCECGNRTKTQIQTPTQTQTQTQKCMGVPIERLTRGEPCLHPSNVPTEALKCGEAHRIPLFLSFFQG